MKLIRFRATKVHGFLPYNVRFNDNLTFLTGINGSGKTTALNMIVALISPNLLTLQTIDYEQAQIDFEDDEGRQSHIAATKTHDSVTVTTSSTEESFSYVKYLGDPAAPSGRQVDLEAEHYRELLASNAHNSVLRFIASLPTPMFLGLDRRARLEGDDRRFAAWRVRSVPGRNIFGGSASGSLIDAVDLAQNAYREARFVSSRIGEDLQKQMLLSLLTFSPEDFGSLSAPTKDEIKDLDRVSADLETFPTIFNLPRTEIQKRVAPFVEDLRKTLKKIPEDFDARKYVVENRTEPPPFINELVKWSTNRSQLKRIRVISQSVANFNERRAQAMEPIERYKGLLNKFLNDSGKSLHFDDHGELQIKIEGISDPRSISSLSSGEAQIFVILTQLTFNASAQKANVFIIDEPELSLHVYWQELFVDSVITANSRIQFIMATHSPSIILDRLSSCVDMSKKGRKSKRD